MLSGLKGRLLVQAGFTAVFALLGSSASSGWTVPTLLVAAGLVFVALAMRPEEQWRWIVTGAVGLSVAYGLVAFVSGHWVPGTIVGGYTLATLLNGSSASAFMDVPAQPPLPAPPVPGYGPPAYGAPAAAPVAAPAAAPVAAAYPPPAPAFAPPVPTYGAPAAYPAPPAYAPPTYAPPTYAPPAPPVEAVPAQPTAYVPPAPPVEPVPAQPTAYVPPAPPVEPVPAEPVAAAPPAPPAPPAARPAAMTVLPGR